MAHHQSPYASDHHWFLEWDERGPTCSSERCFVLPKVNSASQAISIHQPSCCKGRIYGHSPELPHPYWLLIQRFLTGSSTKSPILATAKVLQTQPTLVLELKTDPPWSRTHYNVNKPTNPTQDISIAKMRFKNLKVPNFVKLVEM